MFDIPLPIYFFTKAHPLKASNKRTHIPLPINQFVSLIELKMYRLINYWTNTCKFKIDKITYSKRSLEQQMTLVKIGLYCVLKGNAQFIFLCNPKKLSVNICLVKILKITVTKKVIVRFNNLSEVKKTSKSSSFHNISSFHNGFFWNPWKVQRSLFERNPRFL